MEWNLLGDIVVLLGACLLLGGLFSRLGQSPLVGYLLAGMLLGGPGSIGLVESAHEIEAIAELGVALLLFSLGLEFSTARLRRLGPKPLIGGVAQVLSTILAGAIIALLAGLHLKGAVAFGAMISLSSTAVVLRMLMERAEMDMPHGRNSLAVLLSQDMAVVPLAILMTLLGGGGTATDVAADVGKLLGMAAVLIVGLFLFNALAVLVLGNLTLHRNRELTVIFAIGTGLGAAWAAHSANISPALGAFVAGMLLGNSAFATQVRADVSSLRVVLLTLFFGAAGMVADPIWIFKNAPLVAGVCLALTVGKGAIIWVIFRLLGQSHRVAASTGLCLAQVGEFAFVLGSIGRAADVVSADLYQLVVSVTIVSFVLSAFLVPMSPRFGVAVARLLKESGEPLDPEGAERKPTDVVIIGFGPSGQVAAQPLIDSGLRVVVIDLNRNGVRLAAEMGFDAMVGDATQGEVLEHAHLREAGAVIITVPDHRGATLMLEQVRQMAPHARTVVRSRYQMHTEDFARSGAEHVVGDEEEVGAGIAQHLVEWLQERNRATSDEHAESDPDDDSSPPASAPDA